MTYYNPASGTGTTQEQDYDRGLLGTDLRVYCAPDGDPRLGLNDRIVCISRARRALVADVYPAFKLGGQALISGDGLHPSDQGQAVIAAELRKALRAFTGDLQPPRFTLSGERTQKAGRTIVLILKATSEDLRVTASGRIWVRGRKTAYVLKGVKSRFILRGHNATLRLKVSKKGLRAIRRALQQRKKVSAELTIKARDTAGNSTVNRRTVTLRR